MIINIVACQREISYVKQGNLFLLAAVTIVKSSNHDGHGTKAWVSHCTNLGITLMYFVTVSVLVPHRLP